MKYRGEAMRLILGSFLLWCSFLSYGADALTLHVKSTSPQFTVTLPANPTTGYQWNVAKYDKQHFRLISSRYIAPRTRLIGAGGQMIFTFAPAKGKAYPPTTQMTFNYARPWESTGGTLKQVNINFKK